MSVEYLPKACIHSYYHGVSVFEKLNIKAVMHKRENLVKWPIVYLRHINILLYHMENICFQQNLTFWWQQCVHIHHQTMYYHIGTVFLLFCAQYPRIYFPSPESDQHNSNVSPTIPFHVFQHIERCAVHGRRSFDEKKQCQLCETSSYSIVTEKLYTRKELVVMDSSTVDFHQDFYITAIQ